MSLKLPFTFSATISLQNEVVLQLLARQALELHLTNRPRWLLTTQLSREFPIGVLLNDMVNIDQTRQHINFHKNEVQRGGKVTLLRKGWITTNMIDPGDTGDNAPGVGSRAYVGPSGYISTKQSVPANGYEAGSQRGMAIGEFGSLKDEDGYAKIYVNLPQADNQLGSYPN